MKAGRMTYNEDNDEIYEGYEMVREANTAEKKILNKFKKHVDTLRGLEEKINPLLVQYQREMTMLQAKYMKLITILRANQMEEQVRASTSIDNFWKLFMDSYEGDQDCLEVNLDDMNVYKISEDFDGSLDNSIGMEKPIPKYMDDDWFKKLIFGTDENPEDKEI